MLNDLKKDKLQIILHDELLLSAIEEVFEEAVKQSIPEVKPTDDNSLLGEKYRAYELSRQIIRQGFIDLNSYKIDKKENKPFNKAR